MVVMSNPIDDDEQERLAVSWRTKLVSNAALGLIGWLVDFVDRLLRSNDIVFLIVKDAIAIVLVAATIYKHYPVNKYLVIFYLSVLTIFIQFVYENSNASVVERLDKTVLLFYGAKLLFDLTVWVTGSRLV